MKLSQCYFISLIFLLVGLGVGKGSYYTCYDYKKAGHDTSTIYTIFLPSGSYEAYCEMGINGGGYTFLSPKVITKLHQNDLIYLLNGKTKAEDVLLRLSNPDGSQPYTVIKQLINTGGLTVKLHENQTVWNKHLNQNIFVGVIEGLVGITKAGMIVNETPITNEIPLKSSCTNYFGYFGFYPNEKEVKPVRYYHKVHEETLIAVEWRSKAARPYSTRRIPLEYFMLTEVHFSCIAYTSSDVWLNSKYPALGTAIGLR